MEEKEYFHMESAFATFMDDFYESVDITLHALLKAAYKEGWKKGRELQEKQQQKKNPRR
ncbi:MAG: hypothetical protein LBI19_11185 [Oscillospiraceae bacterium]|jgi:hypothetical protein|nr:hypothetical protein [Oscillospiraceae bacterium]